MRLLRWHFEQEPAEKVEKDAKTFVLRKRPEAVPRGPSRMMPPTLHLYSLSPLPTTIARCSLCCRPFLALKTSAVDSR